MNKKVIAIMYDFDKTLCTKDMQEYSFIPNLGITPKEFWTRANKIRLSTGMDSVLTYMYLMQSMMKEKNIPLTRDYLNQLGKNIEYFNGVPEWFKKINEFGAKYGLTIEHYVISSGIKEIIEGSLIGPYFKEIYASEFYYEDNIAVWPKLAINYTNKTQYLMRIKKGALDIKDDISINKKMQETEKRISFDNMIYIGDGLTDVPCMKLTKDGGGCSIAVYTDKSINIAKTLKNDERINYQVQANYDTDSDIYEIVTKKIESIALKIELDTLAKTK